MVRRPLPLPQTFPNWPTKYGRASSPNSISIIYQLKLFKKCFNFSQNRQLHKTHDRNKNLPKFFKNTVTKHLDYLAFVSR